MRIFWTKLYLENSRWWVCLVVQQEFTTCVTVPVHDHWASRKLYLETNSHWAWDQSNNSPPHYWLCYHDCDITHSSKRNKLKKGERQFPGLSTAVAILLKERNKTMCGVQSYLSSALFSTHIQKKVCVWLCVIVCDLWLCVIYNREVRGHAPL